MSLLIAPSILTTSPELNVLAVKTAILFVTVTVSTEVLLIHYKLVISVSTWSIFPNISYIHFAEGYWESVEVELILVTKLDESCFVDNRVSVRVANVCNPAISKNCINKCFEI